MVCDCAKSPGAGILIAGGLCALALWLLTPAAAALEAGRTEDAYDLDIRPIWEGYLKPGAESELQLRLLAPRGGRGSIVLQGSLARVQTEIAFEPGMPLTLRLPLAHDRAEALAVELYSGGELLLRRELDLTLLPAAARVFAVVGGRTTPDWQPPAPLRDTDTLLQVQGQDLPHFGRSYAMLSALVIAVSELQALGPQQAQALDEYLGNCGRLYLVGADAPAAAILRARAGCGGRNVIAHPSGIATPWLPGATVSMPAAVTLRQLFVAPESGVLRALLVFLAGYLLVLLLLSRLAQSPLPLLIAPPLAAGLALLGWTLGAPAARIASWAEMDSGDAVARYAGLLQLAGMSRGEQRVALDSRWGIPVGNTVDGAALLHYAPREGRLEIQLPTRLMSSHEFLLRGSTKAPALDVRDTGQGVEVTNRGEAPSPAGTLAWRGHPYRFPMLAAGQVWRLPADADAWVDTPQQQLLRQRAVDGSTWLMLPFQVPALHTLGGDDSSVGWLLVKGNGDA